MYGRHSDRVRINDVRRVRPGTMKDGPDAASEIKVGRNHADRGPRGTNLAMPRQRCLDGAGAPGSPAALSTHEGRDQHVTLALPGLCEKRPQAVGRRLFGQGI